MNKTLTKKLAATAVVLNLTSAATLADTEHPAQFSPAFDQDGAGLVSLEEIQGRRAERFVEIDADRDGYLTLAEIGTWHKIQQQAHFDELDNDGNDSMTAEEFYSGKTGKALTWAKKAFELADGNGDEVLSLDEFMLFGPGNDRLIHGFMRMDTDNDNRISQAEYINPPKRHKPLDRPRNHR